MLAKQQSRKLKLVFLAVLFVLAMPARAEAYIGPGAGFALFGSFLVMFTALVSASSALVSWPVRYVIRAIRRRRAFARSRIKKFVILGLDGMDPKVAEGLLAEGKLPHLATDPFTRIRNT